MSPINIRRFRIAILLVRCGPKPRRQARVLAPPGYAFPSQLGSPSLVLTQVIRTNLARRIAPGTAGRSLISFYFGDYRTVRRQRPRPLRWSSISRLHELHDKDLRVFIDVLLGGRYGSMPIRSFTAPLMRCLKPRYRSEHAIRHLFLMTGASPRTQWLQGVWPWIRRGSF